MSLVSTKRRAMGWSATDVSYVGQDLRSLQAPQSSWQGVTFSNCKLGLSNFMAATFNDVTFERCSIYGTAFTGATLRGVRFVGCDLEQSGFGNSTITSTSFTDCRMAYVSFLGACLRKDTAFSGTNLHGADFDVLESTYGSPVFEDCTLWGVKAPFGCGFWNGKFDQRSIDLFAAMLSRVCPDAPKKGMLEAVAGDSLAAVDRLMREKDDVNK